MTHVVLLFVCVLTLLICRMNAQAAHNDYHLQQATNKIPPSWNPAQAKAYPFRSWLVDLQLWEVATDADIIRHGPMVALRLQGAARDMVREMDANTLANGRVQLDLNGNQYQQSGLQYLLQLLTARFAPLPQEIQLEAISELFTWRRQSGDTYDETITRYELMLFRLQNVGNIALQPPIKTWMLLTALHVPRDRWTTLLFPTLGLLPQTPQEYTQFLEFLRRQGHLFDGTTDRNISHKTCFGDVAVQSPSHEWSNNAWSDASWSEGNWNSQSYAAIQSATDDEEEWSSGFSNADEPIYMSSEISAMPAYLQGEALYLGYRTHKRAFRAFSKSGPRRKGKGKGKGRRKGKGKSKPLFYADGTPADIHDGDEEEFIAIESYYGSGKGSSKSGKSSSGPRKNPRGADGKIMLCSSCGSEDHFVRFCPKGKGKGSTSSSSTYAALPLPSSYPTAETPATTPAPTRLYLVQVIPDFNSVIQYADGTSETLSPKAPAINKPEVVKQNFYGFIFSRVLAYVWWGGELAYHTMVRLRTGEALLVDCGAVGNLCGDKWLERQSAHAAKHGQGVSMTTLSQVVQVEGVGTGASTISQRAHVPIMLQNGSEGEFVSNVVPNSELPALLGLDALERQRALIDTYNHKLIHVGKGGYELKLSPGSVSHDLVKAPSGHLMLPCSSWPEKSSRIKAPESAHR